MNDTKKKTILLVEDEAISAIMAAKILEKHGYQVIHADTGEKAVILSETTPEIDLILMDIDLGSGIDGTAAAEEILKIKDLPLVFLSSHTEPEIVSKTEGITSYDYVVKNTGETVLIASIKMAFRLFDAKLNEKKKEKALLASEERFHHLFERAPLGYQSLNEKGYIVDVNEAWLETLGYEREEVTGKWFGDFLAPDFVDLFNRNFEIFKNAGKMYSEFEMVHKNGKILYIAFDGSIGRSEDGSFEQTHCILQDITERNILQEKLRHSEKIFVHSIDMLCIADFDGYFRFLNPAWEKTLGWTNAELMSRPWIEFVHPDDRSDTENIKTVLVGGREVYQFENRYICKNGSTKWLSWNSFPYEDERVMFGVARDITGQKAAEQAHKENEENLKRAQSMAKLGSWSIDLNNRIVEASKETSAIYGVDGDQWSFDEIKSVPLLQYRDTLHNQLIDLVENNKPYDVEFQIHRPLDNDMRYIHSIAEYDAKKNRVVGTIQDITKRKESEEKIKALLLEKELFLKEIHHRVKNNLQMISGLFTLQMYNYNNNEIKQALKEAQQRIDAISIALYVC